MKQNFQHQISSFSTKKEKIIIVLYILLFAFDLKPCFPRVNEFLGKSVICPKYAIFQHLTQMKLLSYFVSKNNISYVEFANNYKI